MSIHILSLDGWATQDVDDVDDMDLSWEVDATELTAEKQVRLCSLNKQTATPRRGKEVLGKRLQREQRLPKGRGFGFHRVQQERDRFG